MSIHPIEPGKIAELQSDMKRRFAEAAPDGTWMHHLAAQAMHNFQNTFFEIRTVAGDFFERAQADFFFVDGLSVVVDGQRIYFPQLSLSYVKVLNPR